MTPAQFTSRGLLLAGMGRSLAGMLAALLLAVTLSACGELPTATPTEPPPTPSPTPTPTPLPDPRSLLRRAADGLLAIKTAEFSLEHEEGVTVLFPGLEMSRAAGVVEMPTRSQFKVDAVAALQGAFVEVEIITIDGEAYMTDLVSGQWRAVPAMMVPITLSDLGNTLVEILNAIDSPRWAGTVDLDGARTHLVEGRVTSDDLRGLAPGAGTGYPVDLRLWLDVETGMLKQARIAGQVVDTDLPETVRVLRLGGIDAPVTITRPN